MHKVLMLVALLCACMSPVRAHAATPEIVGASSAENMWFVVEEQRTGSDQLPRLFRLLHHAAAMHGPMVSSASTIPALSQYPEAMAAWRNQLWIVNHAQPNQDRPRREVFTLTVHYDTTFEVYQHIPRDRLLSVEPLPADGRLAGFAATAAGPVALLVPTERGVSGVITSDGTVLKDTELSKPRLLRLINSAWEDIPLPDAIAPDAELRLGTSLTGDGALFLFASPIGQTRIAGTSMLFRQLPDGWTQTSIALNLAHVRSLTHVLDQCALVIDDRATERSTIAIVRPDSLLEVAEFATPTVPWTALGLAGDVRLITRGTPPQIFMQRIDPLTGAISEREQFAALRPITASLIHLPILLVLSVAAVLIAFALGKPGEAVPLNLPRKWEVLGPMGRLIALTIDMVPAGFITMFLLRCSLTELVQPPLFVSRLDLAVPYLVMAGITVIYTGIWELINGESLGKSFLHAKVADFNGNRLSTRATLIRLAFKAIVLYIPLLAIFNLTSSRGQGLGGRAVGAVVIAEQEEEQPAAQE